MTNNTKAEKSCPMGSDVGPMGKAEEFFKCFSTGLTHLSRFNNLVTEVKEINSMIENMDDDEKDHLGDVLNEDLKDIEDKIIAYSLLFQYEA